MTDACSSCGLPPLLDRLRLQVERAAKFEEGGPTETVDLGGGVRRPTRAALIRDFLAMGGPWHDVASDAALAALPKPPSHPLARVRLTGLWWIWSAGAWIPAPDHLDPLRARLSAREASRFEDADAHLSVVDPGWWEQFRIGPDGAFVEGRPVMLGWSGEVDVVDPDGMEVFHAGPGGLRYMGQDLSAAAQATPATSGILRRSASDLPRWRSARAAALLGEGRAVVACVGDSNTMGWRAGAGGAHSRARSYPAQAARLLAARWPVPVASENLVGRALQAASGYAAYDPRLTSTGDWAASGAPALGGETWVCAAGTASLVFAPDAPWRYARLWFWQEATAEVAAGVAGAETTRTVRAGLVNVTHDVGALTTAPLRLSRVSGSLRLVGLDVWAGSSVSLLNMGRSGYRTDDWATPDALAALRAVAPDLALVQLGLNDWNQGRGVQLFEADLRVICASVAAHADLALVVPMTPDGLKAAPWSAYAATIRAVAADFRAPVLDFGAPLGLYAEASARGLVYDALHPSGRGYADQAALVATFLAE